MWSTLAVVGVLGSRVVDGGRSDRLRARHGRHREDHTQLKKYAADRGVSLSEAVRRAVRLLLELECAAPSRATLVREALAVAGRYGDPQGRDDVAEEHDHYLDEAFER